MRKLAFVAVILALLMPLVPGHAQSKIVAQPAVLKKSGKKWTFTFRYPQVHVPGALMGVNGAMNDINRQLRQLAESELAAFKKSVADMVGPSSTAPGTSTIDCRYTVLSARGALSVKFDEYTFFQGGAHPETIVITRTWPEGGGPVLTIEGLFADPAVGLRSLSLVVSKDVAAQAKAKKFEIISQEGLNPRAENFQAFGFTRPGLVIYLQRGQAAAGYVGNLTAVVPWAKIQPLLKTDIARAVDAL